MAGRTKGGLTEQHLQEIGAELSNGGRAPKVALRESSSGLPAGTVGAVVRLDDPASSEEFVVVRIRNDELPFTPAELEPAPVRARSTRAAEKVREAPSAPDPGATASQPAGTPAAAATSAPPRPTPTPTPSPATAPTADAPSHRSRPDGARKAAGKRQTPKLTVQVHYDERGWTVEASRGTRSLVKATPVRPAAAMQVANLLDNEQVGQAIAEIVQAERDEAERRAAELRAQLAEVEAMLAGYEGT